MSAETLLFILIVFFAAIAVAGVAGWLDKDISLNRRKK